MEETKTRRAPKRPTATKASEPVAAQAIAPAPKAAKRTIKRSVNEPKNTEFEIMRGGGIVYMLPQKGVTVYDAEKDTVREIRFCPNEPSIFVDEQSSNAVKQSVTFRDGRLFVRKNQPNLRKFLELHPANKANGGTTFKKVDKTKDAARELEKEFLVSDAVSIVRDRDINDLLPIAMYFGININSPVADIRYSLLRIAKNKTEEFMSSLDSPQVACRSSVQQAVDYQIIKLKNDGAYWYDTNKLIVSVPVGQDALNTMVRFCLTEKGASTLSLIEL